MDLKELQDELLTLDAEIASLRDKKRALAREYQELEAAERTAELVASMSDTEKAQLISALGIDSGAKVNGA